MNDYNYLVDQHFDASRLVLDDSRSLKKKILKASEDMIETLEKGGCIFWCGNGGSAGDSQHLAAELVGKFRVDRKPLSSVALTTDTSILTATGNDFGFEEIFARQIQAIGKSKDLLVGITTSGKSLNVIRAFEEAKRIGMKTIAFTGQETSRITPLSNVTLNVPSTETALIQQLHITIGQLVCGIIEDYFFGN